MRLLYFCFFDKFKDRDILLRALTTWSMRVLNLYDARNDDAMWPYLQIQLKALCMGKRVPDAEMDPVLLAAYTRESRLIALIDKYDFWLKCLVLFNGEPFGLDLEE